MGTTSVILIGSAEKGSEGQQRAQRAQKAPVLDDERLNTVNADSIGRGRRLGVD